LGPYTTSLASLRFIEVPVPSHESERSCTCMLGLSNLPLSTILGCILELLCFGNVIFFIFHFIEKKKHNSKLSLCLILCKLYHTYTHTNRCDNVNSLENSNCSWKIHCNRCRLSEYIQVICMSFR
jgi:hypothetical protein